MKNETLYDGITGIREDIVARADAHEFRKKRGMTWKKRTALAACCCLVAGGVYGAARLGLLGGSGAGGGGKTGLIYMSYAGPVFPLTALNGGEGLTATRRIDLDFSPYEGRMESYEADGETQSYEVYDGESIVTDGYTMTNPTGGDITVTAAYPFAAALHNDADTLPAILADGEAVETSLIPGPYSGSFTGALGGGGESLNLAQLDSWEGYKALLEAGYLDAALAPLPVLAQPVTVYEVTDPTAPEEPDAANPTLAIRFSLDYDRTTVLSYGFHGGSYDVDMGHMRQSFSIPRENEYGYGDSRYLILLGDDIASYRIGGYADGGCEDGEEIAGVTANVKRYETTLGEIVDVLLGEYLAEQAEWEAQGEPGDLCRFVSRETYLGLCAQLLEEYGLLSDTPTQRYAAGWLGDIFSEVGGMQRVMYLTFDRTIPAGRRWHWTGRRSTTIWRCRKNRSGAKIQRPALRESGAVFAAWSPFHPLRLKQPRWPWTAERVSRERGEDRFLPFRVDFCKLGLYCLNIGSLL